METLTIKIEYHEGAEKFVVSRNPAGYWNVVPFYKEFGPGIDEVATSMSKAKAQAIAEYLTSHL